MSHKKTHGNSEWFAVEVPYFLHIFFSLSYVWGARALYAVAKVRLPLKVAQLT